MVQNFTHELSVNSAGIVPISSIYPFGPFCTSFDILLQFTLTHSVLKT
jgi:hypothetical protein